MAARAFAHPWLHLVRFSTLLVLPFAAVLAACSGDAPSVSRQPFVDDLGRTVDVHIPATRVVTLAPGMTEIAFAAGAGAKVVGAGVPDDYPPAVDTLPRYAVYPVDFEAIAALQPELVLATDQVNSPRDAETFAALGIAEAFFTFHSLDDVFDSIEAVGHLAGTERVAGHVADSLRTERARLEDLTGRSVHRLSVLVLIGDDTLFSFGSESYMHELVFLAGGRSVMANVDAVAPILSEEYVLTADPDVIIGTWGTDYDVARLLDLHPTWSRVAAIRSGRVYSVDPDVTTRAGPRLIEGAYRIAQLLHPDLPLAATDTTSQ